MVFLPTPIDVVLFKKKDHQMDTETISQDSKCDTCSTRCGKLDVFDWLSDLPDAGNVTDIVEVQFKNTRKEFFRNSNQIKLKKGDVIAVEASPGHDIGEVTLTGELVLLQMKKHNLNSTTYEFKRVYRKAKTVDIDKWEESKAMEHETMLESRRIAERLRLNMKIGDVEYQGDRTKAIFYYIADERVDFRELIKVLADIFKVRIEMRQIGARQEAGRIGGIGPCGRELCCSTWITNFVSVTTNSARYQEISLNPQKLAGQCGKLKCCLNYELDTYIDAQKDFPRTDIPLETENETFYHFKTDIFNGLMWFSSGRESTGNVVMLNVERVKEVIQLNKGGEKVPKLATEVTTAIVKEIDYTNIVGEDSITRFDEQNNKTNKRRKNKRRKNTNRPNNGNKSGRKRRNDRPSNSSGDQKA
jgi:cell fate regulator YaaT (PSP1 superfamily)